MGRQRCARTNPPPRSRRLADRGLTYAIVTDPDGRLLGTVHPAGL
ncbi:hypothetical protein ACVGOW_12795 [Pseudonocardia saturnea]